MEILKTWEQKLLEGTVNKENEDVRALYTQFYVSECKKRNIPCLLWDNNIFTEHSWESFGVFDRIESEWRYPKIIDAIMKVVND